MPCPTCFTLKQARKLTVALPLLALAWQSSVAQAQPRESSGPDVQSCRFLSRVSGDSGYGKNTGWQRIAKHQALQRAEKLGASDVVWERLTPTGAVNGIADARAYDCGTQRAASVANEAEEVGAGKPAAGQTAADSQAAR
jgi:hypothetical protein